MLTLSSKSRWRKQREKEYQQLLNHPCQSLLTSLIEFGLTERAKSIAIGYRNSQAPDHSAPGILSPLLSVQSAVDEAVGWTPGGSVSLKGPDGTREIPVWLETDEGLEPLMLMPILAYPDILAGINKRLLSLNSTPEDPQPARYIELEPNSEGQRRFAEVDIQLDHHNVFWIRLLAQRTLDPDANISW